MKFTRFALSVVSKDVYRLTVNDDLADVSMVLQSVFDGVVMNLDHIVPSLLVDLCSWIVAEFGWFCVGVVNIRSCAIRDDDNDEDEFGLAQEYGSELCGFIIHTLIIAIET